MLTWQLKLMDEPPPSLSPSFSNVKFQVAVPEYLTHFCHLSKYLPCCSSSSVQKLKLMVEAVVQVLRALLSLDSLTNIEKSVALTQAGMLVYLWCFETPTVYAFLVENWLALGVALIGQVYVLGSV